MHSKEARLNNLRFPAIDTLGGGLGTVVPVAPAPMTTVNINLYTGTAMAVFGGFLLWMAKRHS